MVLFVITLHIIFLFFILEIYFIEISVSGEATQLRHCLLLLFLFASAANEIATPIVVLRWLSDLVPPLLVVCTKTEIQGEGKIPTFGLPRISNSNFLILISHIFVFHGLISLPSENERHRRGSRHTRGATSTSPLSLRRNRRLRLRAIRR